MDFFMQKPTTTESPAKYGTSGMSQFLVAVFIATVAYFVYWGLGYTAFNHSFIFLLACAFGLFMAFNIGGNDVANSFGTSVGAGTLSITQALIVAAVFEVSGALIAGKEVTDTISKGIVDLSVIDIQPMQFVFVMMSALIAAALWLLFASYKGLPVSTTHSIIGGIVVCTTLCADKLIRAHPAKNSIVNQIIKACIVIAVIDFIIKIEVSDKNNRQCLLLCPIIELSCLCMSSELVTPCQMIHAEQEHFSGDVIFKLSDQWRTDTFAEADVHQFCAADQIQP